MVRFSNENIIMHQSQIIFLLATNLYVLHAIQWWKNLKLLLFTNHESIAFLLQSDIILWYGNDGSTRYDYIFLCHFRLLLLGRSCGVANIWLTFSSFIIMKARDISNLVMKAFAVELKGFEVRFIEKFNNLAIDIMATFDVSWCVN